MASQDETPTHRPTAAGEPPKDAQEMPETEAGSAPADGSSATLHGANEHDAWDAEFNGLSSGAASGAGNAAAAPKGGDTAHEPAPADGPAAGGAGTGRGAGDGADREDTPADAGEAAGTAPAGQSESTSAEDTPVGTGESGDSAEATRTPGSGAVTPDTNAPDMTVPGGHPGVAQRSHLPMRRASTLPDLSRYASGSDAAPTDSDAPDSGTASAEAVSADRGSRAAGEKTGSRAAGATAGATAVPGMSGAAASLPSADSAAAGSSADARAASSAEAPASGDSVSGDSVSGDSAAGSGSGADTRTTAFSAADVRASDRVAADKGSAVKASANKDSAVADAEASDRSESAAEEDSLSPAEAERRAREREKAAAGKPVLARVLQVMIAVFFPVMLLAAAIRAVATPLFLWAEYHRPGFPADSYGFTTDDRMTYGSYAVDYLLNWSGPRYLGDLVGDGGEPLYLESEVSHMADVKTVLTAAFVAALVMAVLSICAAFYLARRSPGGIRRALFAGAALTLVLVLVLLTLAILGWEQFFTQLHTVFFANGNWTFRLDDTLIRLFPAQFWMDAGIVIAALVLLTCAVVLACCWPTKARRNRARAAREAARRRYTESLDAL